MNDTISNPMAKLYTYIKRNCGSGGEIYCFPKNKFDRLYCRNWACGRCRKSLKFELYRNVVNSVLMFGLDKHFVITFKGNDLRLAVDPYMSYRFMSQAWNRFKKVIEYKYGKLTYICFPRAQKSGYCHYHIIMDKRVSWKFLDEKRKSQDLGFVSIQHNKSVADYLHQDFFKDHEYWIPENCKHYMCSRNIIINNFRKDDWWKGENVFMANMSMKEKVDFINEKFFYPLPFEEYVKEFYTKVI